VVRGFFECRGIISNTSSSTSSTETTATPTAAAFAINHDGISYTIVRQGNNAPSVVCATKIACFIDISHSSS